jgi:hypothetical protein
VKFISSKGPLRFVEAVSEVDDAVLLYKEINIDDLIYIRLIQVLDFQ